MKYLVIILTLFSLTASAQIDQAVDTKISNRITAANIPAQIKSAVDSAMQEVVWYTELQKTVTRTGSFNLDTLTAAPGTTEVYQLTLTGAGTAVRIVFVTNSNGTYSSRVVNPASYSGPSGTSFNATTGNTGVIISMTGNTTSRTYKYGRKNL